MADTNSHLFDNILKAPTSSATRLGEASLTYLNQGKYYHLYWSSFYCVDSVYFYIIEYVYYLPYILVFNHFLFCKNNYYSFHMVPLFEQVILFLLGKYSAK